MNKTNSTIGIIGGMGPQASAKLLESIVFMCSKDFGAKEDSDFPEIILNSVSVPDFISNKRTIAEVLEILKKRVKNLEKFNPSFLAISCNTAHLMLKDLQADTNIPFVSIIEEVTKRVAQSKIKKVGILGTPTTIKSELYQNKLSEINIKFVIPSKLEILVIESVIRNVLAGKIKDEDQQKLTLIAQSLTRKGAQGVILGCTELPLIFPKKFSIPVFDSIEILARSLVQNAYETDNKNAMIKV